jgi:hypothetical protein
VKTAEEQASEHCERVYDSDIHSGEAMDDIRWAFLQGHKAASERVAELESALLKYKTGMDKIYNHNEAARHAVIEHFGIHHPLGIWPDKEKS